MSQSQTLCELPAPEDELTAELAKLEAEEVAIEEQERLKREREAVEQELRQAKRERRKEEMREEMRRREEEKRKAREEAEQKAKEERRIKEQEWKEREEWEKAEKEEQEWREKEETEKQRKEDEKKKWEEENTRKRKDKGKEKEKAMSPGASSPPKKKKKIFVGTGIAGSSRSAQESEIVEVEDESEEELGPQKKMGGKNPCWKCRNTGYPCEPHPMKLRNACIRCTQMHSQCVEKWPPLLKREGVSGPAGNRMTREQGAELLLVMQALAQSNMWVAEGIERLVEVTERLDRWQDAALRVLARPEDGAEEVGAQQEATVEKPETAGAGEMGKQGEESGSEGSSSGEEDSGEEEGPAGDGMDLGE